MLDEYTCAVSRLSPVHNEDAVIDKPGPMHVQVIGETKRERERERGGGRERESEGEKQEKREKELLMWIIL